MEEVILTEGLTKHYKEFKAVDDVNLSVKKGEIYGFIGLNGAGKTTTIRMLLGMVRPTSGSCFINGERITTNSHHLWQEVGYMVETPYSYPELTVKENLEIVGRLRQIRESTAAVNRVIEQLKLTPYANRKARQLSLGNAQRLGIAKALLHEPDLLILDEPANGLDPAGMVEIRELLQDLAFNQGKTIFLSSHILSEVAKIASKIGIIHSGKLIQEMDAEKLEELLLKRLLINTKNNSRAKSLLEENNFIPTETANGCLQLNDSKAVLSPEKIAELLVHAGTPPTQLLVEEEDLEGYFLRVVGLKDSDALRDA